MQILWIKANHAYMRNDPTRIRLLLPVAINNASAYINPMDNWKLETMKSFKIMLAVLTFAFVGQISMASAREIQTYRPAPRGLDVTPRSPTILRNNSPYRDSLRDCSTGNCYNGRANRPTGNSGPTQAEKCRAAYQSYRAFDNTYKPYNRPRERCNL